MSIKKYFSLFSILIAVMLMTAPAMACGFGQNCPLISSEITLSGDAVQTSGGAVNTTKGNLVNGANAGAGFSQTSEGLYSATFDGTSNKPNLNASGAANADGIAQITTDLDKITNGYKAEVKGELNNSALATATGPNCAMTAEVVGSGNLQTYTDAFLGLNTNNGVLGQTSTDGSFKYVIDPTKSVEGQGSLSGTGTAIVQQLTGDNPGFKVITGANSTAGASVMLVK